MTRSTQIRFWSGLLLSGLLIAVAMLLFSAKHQAATKAPLRSEKKIIVAEEPGGNLGEKLKQCLHDLGSEGGVCDATSMSGQQVAKTDPFAGTTGSVKVLLGNATIETSQGWNLPDHVELAGQGLTTVLRLA